MSQPASKFKIGDEVVPTNFAHKGKVCVVHGIICKSYNPKKWDDNEIYLTVKGGKANLKLYEGWVVHAAEWDLMKATKGISDE